jgi:uncharacterized phage infection (PIP) family protein YhgE
LRIPFTRMAGVILVITAIAGLVISIWGLFWTWMTLPDISQNLQGNVRLLSEALGTTSEGLVLAEHSLQTSISSITTLEAAVEATGKSINDTTPMIETMVILAREDLPATVNSAQLSVVAAQDSAEIIDGVLSFLSGLPLVPRNLYNPPVPLHIALGQVSESMENIPAALITIEDSLNATSANLVTIEADIYLIAQDISEINASMAEGHLVLTQYQELISDLQIRTAAFENGLPDQLRMLSIILTVVLVWVVFSQVAFLFQGLSLLNRSY